LLHFGFVIFWRKNIGAKGRHKMFMKLTPGFLYYETLIWFSTLIKYHISLFIEPKK